MATVQRPADPHRRRRLTVAIWGNPLARASDRFEAAAALLAIVLWSLAVPIVATAGTMLWHEVSTAAARQQQQLTQTVAKLDGAAPSPGVGAYGVPFQVQAPVSAHWVAPDGAVRSGTVMVGSDVGDADQVPVWLNADGNPVAPPIETATAAILVVIGTVAGWLLVGVLLGAGLLALRWRLNRQRRRAWDRDWALVEPLWSGR